MSDLPLLHAVRIKGLATDEVLADVLDVEADALADRAAPLRDAGHLQRREGRFAGWSLTASGKELAARTLVEDPATVAAQDALAAAYAAFLPVNGDLKRVCSAWQMREGQPNDHADAAYDAGVVDDLAAVDARAQDLLAPLAEPLPRVARYGPRLASALARLRAGDAAAFARPMANSYHDIWMELHEDLLLSCGRARDAADEG